jgi:hypothetical protein
MVFDLKKNYIKFSLYSFNFFLFWIFLLIFLFNPLRILFRYFLEFTRLVLSL